MRYLLILPAPFAVSMPCDLNFWDPLSSLRDPYRFLIANTSFLKVLVFSKTSWVLTAFIHDINIWPIWKHEQKVYTVYIQFSAFEKYSDAQINGLVLLFDKASEYTILPVLPKGPSIKTVAWWIPSWTTNRADHGKRGGDAKWRSMILIVCTCVLLTVREQLILAVNWMCLNSNYGN